jgi:hypothetical protein
MAWVIKIIATLDGISTPNTRKIMQLGLHLNGKGKQIIVHVR